MTITLPIKEHKNVPEILFHIGQVVAVKPWRNHKGQIVEIQIKRNNEVYYCVELLESYDAITCAYGMFNKGELS